MHKDFVFLDEALPGVRWDAKYAGSDNFTGAPVDGYLTRRVAGTRALAKALAAVQARLASAGYGLLLWDAYRPQRAVDCFLRWADMPEDGRTKAKHYPNIDRRDMVPQGYVAAKSGHSRGSTVDLTLWRLDLDLPLAMGGDFDLMDPISCHGAKGVSPEAAHNRAILRAAMEEGGFRAYEGEWWHYTLRDEPYPDTYFNFPISDE